MTKAFHAGSMHAQFCLATEEDLGQIVDIYNATIPGRQVTADLEPVTVEQRRPWFAAHQTSRHPLWVLKVDAKVLGWMSLSAFYGRAAYDGTAEVSIYVSDSAQKMGVGQYLLDQAIEYAPSQRIHTLLGFIFAHNEKSMRLFEKNGFALWANLPNVAKLDDDERSLIILGKRIA